MISAVSIPEFKTRFGTSERRLALLASLDNFLHALSENFSSFRVVAYGSFTSDKTEPSDIDVMVCVCSSPTDQGFNKYKRLQELADASVDVFTLRLGNSFCPAEAPPDAAAMVQQFNDFKAHVTKGIRCERAIELLIRSMADAGKKSASSDV
jgi:predicted nucleotidyltransferase